MAGVVLTLIGASAGVGYATLRSAQSSATATQQMAASLAVPDFVESMGDPYYPSFDELDQDGDGVVGYQEYMRDLNKVWTKDRETTTDILNQLGVNDIDKDIMTKDEFQLQIGVHFSKKVTALQKAARDVEAENAKTLNQQTRLEDCILQAANKARFAADSA
ncbi:hypothetical protein KRP22_006215 [Phytophthora ramorum]|nr:hypothetical protein KRP22_2652 [Phytophthora ramorum]